MGDANTGFKNIDEAHEIFQTILLAEKHRSKAHIVQKLRTLRSAIYEKLDKETDVQISVRINDRYYNFKIGSTKTRKTLIINAEWSFELKDESGILEAAWRHREMIAVLVYGIVITTMESFLEKDTFNKIYPFVWGMCPAFGFQRFNEYMQNAQSKSKTK